jgi:hypothetical protein
MVEKSITSFRVPEHSILISPVGQMFKPVRLVATIIFLASIVLVFVGAFVIGSDVSQVSSVGLTMDAHVFSHSCYVSVRIDCLFMPVLIWLTYSNCSSRRNRVLGLYVVHSILHPIRPTSSTQGIWHVMDFALTIGCTLLAATFTILDGCLSFIDMFGVVVLSRYGLQ